MRQWTVSRQSALLLLAVLFVIILVLVLPQVDLLDTAFHRGTAPILVHAQATAKPAFQNFPGLFVFFLPVIGVAPQTGESRFVSYGAHDIQILNRCFRC